MHTRVLLDITGHPVPVALSRRSVSSEEYIFMHTRVLLNITGHPVPVALSRRSVYFYAHPCSPKYHGAPSPRGAVAPLRGFGRIYFYAHPCSPRYHGAPSPRGAVAPLRGFGEFRCTQGTPKYIVVYPLPLPTTASSGPSPADSNKPCQKSIQPGKAFAACKKALA